MTLPKNSLPLLTRCCIAPCPSQEVSGYIDYGHRLKTESMEPYFDRKKRLMPRPSDLSFYNWETQMSTSNPTPNFQVREVDLGAEGGGGGEGETV